jgi:glutamate/tyrosine decarboxylase-like PLP-dependent enzyme
VAALDAALAGDRANHITPIAVVASAGTTNTGAIDDLAAIAGTCRRHQVWLHVDAAYGGPAILTDAYVDRLRATRRGRQRRAGSTQVAVRAGRSRARLRARREAMRSAFSLVPPYLRTDGSLTGVGGPIWFSEFGFQQTRGFRALKVWMAMKEFGLAGYKAAIEANVALAAYLADCVRAAPEPRAHGAARAERRLLSRGGTNQRG